MGNKLPIVKNLALDYSSENVLTIYSNGDNSYNTITNLNRLRRIGINNVMITKRTLKSCYGNSSLCPVV